MAGTHTVIINIGCCGGRQPPPAERLLLWVRGAPGQIITLKGDTMLLLTDVQHCSLHIQPVDARGNAAAIDGDPVWTVSDQTILSITPSVDGMTATITALGPLGTCQVNVTADADLGDGTHEISGVLDVQVQAGEAVSLGITADTPEAA